MPNGKRGGWVVVMAALIKLRRKGIPHQLLSMGCLVYPQKQLNESRCLIIIILEEGEEGEKKKHQFAVALNYAFIG